MSECESHVEYVSGIFIGLGVFTYVELINSLNMSIEGKLGIWDYR
jgi:hypothetical protein